ncbi:MAG: hypothetical protein L0154_25945 [Chloroflexi bacterium]|nr:hypothetical protein [Chloroflexota bacterium]
MKHLFILLLICAVLMPTLPASTAQPPASDAPYIYYYSERLNAFVIERADGTDSRVFAEGFVHEEANSVAGAGWSPSGEWFGFTSIYGTAHGPRPLGGEVLHVTGQKRLTSIESFKADIQFMMWADDRDLLLISTMIPIEDSVMVDRNWYLVDASNDAIVSVLKRKSYYRVDMLEIEQVDEYFLIGDFVPEVGQRIYYRLDFNGEFTEIIRGQEWSDAAYGISPQGWTLYSTDEDQYYAINLTSGRQIQLEQVGDPQWSNYGAILYGDEDHIWYLDGDRGILKLLPSEFTTSTISYNRDSWSPDGRYFVLWDDTNRIYLFDAESQEIIDTGIVVDASTISFQDFYWDSDGRLFFYEFEDDDRVIVYDDGTISYLELPVHQMSVIAFSPDEQMLATVWDGPVIYSLDTRDTQYLLPHSGSFRSNLGGEPFWDDDGQWFLVGQESCVAGGCGGSPNWINVVSIDGSVNRELTYCGDRNACVNWLPERVDVSKLPQGQPESVLPEPPEPLLVVERGEWTDELYWSVDSNYIQLDSLYYGEPDPVIDLTTGELIAEGKEGLGIIQIPFSRTNEILARTDEWEFIGEYTSGEGYRYYVQDRENDTVLFEMEEGLVIEAAGSEANNLLAVKDAYNAHCIQLWDVDTGSLLTCVPVYASTIAFSPDGTKLAAGVSWEVWIWDVEDLVAGE